MGILVLILLVWAAFSGALWSVLKIAAGVALGIFLGGMILVFLGYLAFRRAVGGRVRRLGRGR